MCGVCVSAFSNEKLSMFVHEHSPQMKREKKTLKKEKKNKLIKKYCV